MNIYISEICLGSLILLTLCLCLLNLLQKKLSARHVQFTQPAIYSGDYGGITPVPILNTTGGNNRNITLAVTVGGRTGNVLFATINLTVTNPGKAKDTTSATRETQTRQCNTTSFLTVGVGGRLGNQMGEYATLLSHSLRLKMIPFIPKHQKKMLSAIFRWGFLYYSALY